MSLFAAPFLEVPAWTPIAAPMRYPATGTFDVSGWRYVGGVFGLNPSGEHSRGTLTLFWTTDADGQHIVGPQGIHHTSLIPSLNQLRLPNQGPYLYAIYHPFVGPNPLHANLFLTDVGHPLQEIPGDTILVDERNRELAAHTSEPIYPCDYFAGGSECYFAAPQDVTAMLYGADLTDQFWPLRPITPGSQRIVTPLGTWFIVVSNANAGPVTYTLAVTPLLQ